MLKKEALKREPSTGNVFADLGMPEAGEHLIKAGLVVRINHIIRRQKLTQAAAAQLMGIDQPKVSAMLAGQFRGYSVERLMRFLVALGHDVEIVVKPRKRSIAELRVA
jgi:predicted XRE-type DNA-binding protein